VKIFEKVVTVKLRGIFTRPLHSSTGTSCTDTNETITKLLQQPNQTFQFEKVNSIYTSRNDKLIVTHSSRFYKS